MKLYNLKNMTRGWFIGDFDPSVFKSNFEVGVKKFKSGEKEELHFHKLSKEFTLVISGLIKMNGIFYSENDIIEVNSYEKSDFECIEDCIIVVVKTGSHKKDKYIV